MRSLFIQEVKYRSELIENPNLITPVEEIEKNTLIYKLPLYKTSETTDILGKPIGELRLVACQNIIRFESSSEISNKLLNSLLDCFIKVTYSHSNKNLRILLLDLLAKANTICSTYGYR